MITCPRCGQKLARPTDRHGNLDRGECQVRPLYVIAREIVKDPASEGSLWCAGPYLNAMLVMSGVDEHYGSDSGRTVVLYALDNLKAWRGETARRIKAELRSML